VSIVIEWNDDAIVLSARKHGEAAAIVRLLTRDHGCYAGLARGGAGRRQRGLWQPGNRVRAQWRARLADHLGTLTGELNRAGAAPLMDDGPRLGALSAACALVESTIAEREPHPVLFHRLDGLIEALIAASAELGWGRDYVRFELDLLAELGFGLDLSACAATGRTDSLTWVSPKSGRAVSAAAGQPYRDRLLALPAFLIDAASPASASDLRAGLALTGHFLTAFANAAHIQALPKARERLGQAFARFTTTSCDSNTP
jgi:DNA repair protein RecO (recombination protein O)